VIVAFTTSELSPNPPAGFVPQFNGALWIAVDPSGLVTLVGDVSGPVGANKVVAWRNQPLDPATMAAPAVGNVPSWDGAKWIAAAPAATTSVTMAGDVTGNSATSKVVAWRNQPLDPATMAAPAVGNVPSWDGAKWIAAAPVATTSVTMGGDVAGNSATSTVVRWENQPLDNVTMAAPAVGNIPTWDGAKWKAQAPAAPPSLVQTFNRTEYWGATTDGANTLLGFMNCDLGKAGGIANPAPTTTSLLKSTKRVGFTITAGAGGSTMGTFDVTGLLNVWRGNAAGLGGFNLRLRFAFELAAAGTLHRVLAGLISQSGSSGAQDWTTQLGIASIGVGFTQTPAPNFTGNWKLIHGIGDAITAPTVLDLGATMPVNITDLMQLDLLALPNDTLITYTVTNLSTGAVVTGTVNANFPASTKFMAMWCANACGNGSTSNGQFDVIEYAFQSNF
jgi:hypothetical protein